MSLPSFLNKTDQKKVKNFLSGWSADDNYQTNTLRQGKIDGITFSIIAFKRKGGDEIIGYFFKKPHPRLKIRYQNLKLLQKNGFDQGRFTAPNPVYYSKNILLRSATQDKNFWHQAQKNPQILERQIKNIALWLKKLHQQKIKKAFLDVFQDDKKKIDSYIDSIVKARLAKQNELIKIKTLLAKAKKVAKLTFIHNDFHPENIFFAGNKIIVIDFDASGKGDPLMDLGYFIAQLRYRVLIREKIISQKLFDQIVKKFLASYFAKKNIKPDTLAKINLYQTRSDLRLAGFITKFIIPQAKNNKEKKKFIQEAKYLVKLIKNKINN